MSEAPSDFDLLQQFARAGSQGAFRDVVRRHLDLVYGTAMRKAGDAGGAEEIAQNVFSALARKAWTFAPDDSLPAWLHKTALLESKNWVRGELRRRRRENAAAELGTTMNTTDEKPAFSALVPLLDEALLSLREKDRAALLLRFYEKQSLRDVGASLGVSEDTAQKRVTSALEKISDFFQRRGFRTASAAAAGSALQHTSATASAATFVMVANAALDSAPPALAGLGLWLTRLASLTKVQTAVLCVAVAAAPVAWQWNDQRQASQEFAHTSLQLTDAQAKLAALQSPTEKLRASSAQLETSLAEAEKTVAENTEATRKFEDWKQRVRGLLMAADYRWPEASPFVRIPKSALQSLNVRRTVSPAGVLSQEARELLGLTPGEREQMEAALREHIATTTSLIDSKVYETNQATHANIPAAAVVSKVWVVPTLGADILDPAAKLETAMQTMLGGERWPLVAAMLQPGGTDSLRSVLNLDAGTESQETAVSLVQRQGQLQVDVSTSRGYMTMNNSGLALTVFAPGAEMPAWMTQPGKIKDLEGLAEGPNGPAWMVRENFLLGASLPQSVRQRATQWLQEQAATRLGKEPGR